jgi:hypothetical protein
MAPIQALEGRHDRLPRIKDQASITISNPADLLGLVPYLLGFHPAESLVLLVIHDARVLLTARIDMVGFDAADQVVERFAELADRHQASGLVLFGYSETIEPTLELMAELVDGLSGLGLVDAFFVDGSRWWSLMCSTACCPAEGTVYDLSSHRMAAEAVFAGLTFASGRVDLERQVSGPPATDFPLLAEVARQVAQETNRLDRQQRKQLVAAKVQQHLAEVQPPTDAECARLALLVFDVEVRDVAWARMERSAADDHVALWSQVVARTIAPWECAPLCLLGMAAWISGNGALQNCCSDRVHRIDPTYSMAKVLDDISQTGLHPDYWDLMSAEMREGTGPLAG